MFNKEAREIKDQNLREQCRYFNVNTDTPTVEYAKKMKFIKEMKYSFIPRITFNLTYTTNLNMYLNSWYHTEDITLPYIRAHKFGTEIEGTIEVSERQFEKGREIIIKDLKRIYAMTTKGLGPTKVLREEEDWFKYKNSGATFIYNYKYKDEYYRCSVERTKYFIPNVNKINRADFPYYYKINDTTTTFFSDRDGIDNFHCIRDLTPMLWGKMDFWPVPIDYILFNKRAIWQLKDTYPLFAWLYKYERTASDSSRMFYTFKEKHFNRWKGANLKEVKVKDYPQTLALVQFEIDEKFEYEPFEQNVQFVPLEKEQSKPFAQPEPTYEQFTLEDINDDEDI